MINKATEIRELLWAEDKKIVETFCSDLLCATGASHTEYKNMFACNNKKSDGKFFFGKV